MPYPSNQKVYYTSLVCIILSCQCPPSLTNADGAGEVEGSSRSKTKHYKRRRVLREVDWPTLYAPAPCSKIHLSNVHIVSNKALMHHKSSQLVFRLVEENRKRAGVKRGAWKVAMLVVVCPTTSSFVNWAPKRGGWVLREEEVVRLAWVVEEVEMIWRDGVAGEVENK